MCWRNVGALLLSWSTDSGWHNTALRLRGKALWREALPLSGRILLLAGCSAAAFVLHRGQYPGLMPCGGVSGRGRGWQESDSSASHLNESDPPDRKLASAKLQKAQECVPGL